MPHVEFAPALTRHVACAPQDVDAHTLREALARAFDAAPGMRNYVLDDQGCVRKHVAVFINSRMVTDRTHLDVPLERGDNVMVIQALTGG